MLATVASPISAAVAGQQQYTSRKTDTWSEGFHGWSTTLRFTENMSLCDLLDFDKDVPVTPGLVWDSDTNSTASASPLQSVFEAWDDYEVEVDESGAQIINILSHAPFYIPHPEPRPFNFAPFSDPVFPDNDIPSTDIEFHEELSSADSDETTVASENPVIIVDLWDTSEELSNQSEWLSARACLPRPASWKSVPDVPIDFLADEDLIEAFSCATPIVTSGSAHLLPLMSS